APAIGAAPRVIVREVIPAGPVCGVVLAHRAPLALGEVGTPALPVPLAVGVLGKADLLGAADHGPIHHVRWRPARGSSRTFMGAARLDRAPGGVHRDGPGKRTAAFHHSAPALSTVRAGGGLRGGRREPCT